MKSDIHDYKKRLGGVEKKIERDHEVSEENKALIWRFRDNCFSEGMSLARIVRYLYCLRDLAVWLGKGFEAATKDELRTVVARIERMEHYADATKYEYKMTLKKLYRWLKDSERPEETAWLKLRRKNSEKRLPHELLSPEDVERLIEQTRSTRDRALVSLLYETGCRVGEFLTLRIRNVEFDEFGARLHLSGKTGERKIRVVNAVQALTEWLNRHPQRSDPESFIWVREGSGQLISYAALCKVIRVAAERCGLGKTKRLHPHNFRHSRATYLANYLTEQQLKVFFGWEQASKMAAVYVHLSGQDMDRALLGSVYGIEGFESRNTKPAVAETVGCLRCKEINSPSNRFCYRCGEPLGQDEQQKATVAAFKRKAADTLMDELVKDPEVVSLLLRKIKEHGLGEIAESL